MNTSTATNKENIKDNFKGFKILNENIKNGISPLKKNNSLENQLEVTQKLLNDFELKSPRKRVNENNIESPSKRTKEPIDSKNSSITDSPRPRVSKFSLTKDTLSSTPKSKHKPKFQNLCQKDEKEKVERNLSKSWIDIMEDQEEQNKELKEYINKVCEKYKLKEEDLVKNLECDTEVLRKRQKQINYGKLTDEYKAYSTQKTRKERKKHDPKTPNKFLKCSRRRFDGLIKKWRKTLHIWAENPNNLKNAVLLLESDEIDENTTDADIIDKFPLEDYTINTNSSSDVTNNE